MTDSLTIPLVDHDNARWGDLGIFGHAAIDVVAEKYYKIEEHYSFKGGHRVRLFRFKKQVHFKVPAGFDVNIAAVRPVSAPRQPRR